MQHIGWRASIVNTALVGFALTVLFWLVVRDNPDSVARQKPLHRRKNNFELLKTVLENPQTWWNGFYAFCCWAPIPIFAELWGVPFLTELLRTNTATAAGAISIIWIGIAIGGPFFGWWSSYLGLRRPPLIVASAIGLLSSIIIIHSPHPSWGLLYVVLFLYGAAASAQAVSFGIVYDNIHPEAQGTAVGFNNMACIASGLLLLPLVGFVLHLFWAGAMSHGTPIYMLSSYRVGLSTIPLCALAGLMTAIWGLKETHCKPQYET